MICSPFLNSIRVYMDIIYKILNETGRYGPIILMFYSFYLLWPTSNLFFYYTVGIFMNSILNLILKGIFKHPRPSEDLKQFNLALQNGNLFVFKDNIPHDIFGMPSGHAQSSLFSTIYVFLSIKKINILVVYLTLSFITMYQRVQMNEHIFLQVLVGAICGALFAYVMYYMAQQQIKGTIREKKDDDGPL